MKKISKNYQKQVSGGYMAEPGDEAYTLVQCTTPGGTESWKRACTGTSDATQICKSIYPAWGNEVSGSCIYTVTFPKPKN